jgi:hypothetical protein
VEYKSGATNTVANALSRRDTEEAGELLALSLPSFALFDDLHAELAGDPALCTMRDEVLAGGRGEQWQLTDGLITVHGKIYVPALSSSISRILESVHDVGHEGAEKTLHRLWADFHIPDARRAVLDFVKSCATCQRNKTEQLHPVGLPQPLELSSVMWADGKLVILTIIDKFSKAAHFLPLGHPYTATLVARVFFDRIVRVHGIPSSIVSERQGSHVHEPVLAGVVLAVRRQAEHPQSDVKSEVTNKVITMYLRCLVGTGREASFNGCHGLSFATTRPIIPQ